MKIGLSMQILSVLFALGACTSAADHARDVNAAREGSDRLTVGVVQREIRIGMSGAEVASVLGSPNIVTTDAQRRESWVYDRISTERIYSASAGGVNALFLGGVSGNSGAAQTSQRSLTIIIHYDQEGRVRDFSYRSSSF